MPPMVATLESLKLVPKPEYDEFAMSVEGKLFDNQDEPMRNFILIWNHMLEAGHRTSFYSKLVSLRRELDYAINRKTKYS